MAEEENNTEEDATSVEVSPENIAKSFTDVSNFRKLIKNSCKMCAHPDRARWEADILGRHATQKEASVEMGFSDQLVSEHMRWHVGQQAAVEVFDSPVVKELATNLQGAIGMLNGYLTQLTKRGNAIMDLPIDAKSEFAIKAHLSEVRELVKLLMELQGNIQQAPTVKIQEMNVQFDDFRDKVMDILCPMCRRNVADGI